MTTAAALHLLHRPGRTEAHGHLDDAKVVETQQAEKAPENVHHRAAWHETPKTQNRNRVRQEMPLRNSSQHSPLLSANLRAGTQIGPTPAQGNRGPGRPEIVGYLRPTRALPAGLITPQKSPSSARRRSAYHGPKGRSPAHGGHCLKASARPVTQIHRLYPSIAFLVTLSRGW